MSRSPRPRAAGHRSPMSRSPRPRAARYIADRAFTARPLRQLRARPAPGRVLARRRRLLRRRPADARWSASSSPGIDPDELNLEIQGRELVVAGVRRAAGRPRAGSTSSSRSPTARSAAPSRSAPTSIADGARATYEDGILRVELPLAPADPRATSGTRSSSPSRPRRMINASVRRTARKHRLSGARSAAARAAGPAAARLRAVPRHAARRSRSARSARSSWSTTCSAATGMLVMVATRSAS